MIREFKPSTPIEAVPIPVFPNPPRSVALSPLKLRAFVLVETIDPISELSPVVALSLSVALLSRLRVLLTVPSEEAVFSIVATIPSLTLIVLLPLASSTCPSVAFP